MRHITAAATLVWACGVFAASGRAPAQAPSAATGEDDASVRAYWTPERLTSSIPMEKHPGSTRPDGTPYSSAALAPVTGTAARVAGGLPTNLDDWTQQVYPAKDLSVSQLPAGTRLDSIDSSSDVQPDSINSSYGYPFTETRVFADGSEVKNYPYSASGRLFFVVQKSGGVDSPGNYNCGASVIAQRLVVTAGHCLGSPIISANGQGFIWYSKWLFIPADNNGTAPFGSWTANPKYVTAGGAWRLGNGTPPNEEDWGILVMNDQNGVKIAQKTGWFGFETNSLENNNVTVLGYPGNLDKGELMQQDQAQVDDSGGSNTYLIGSASGKGGSGGPWVEGFGQGPSCTGSACPTGRFNGMGVNAIVGVTSYLPSGTTGYLGASQINSDFQSEYNLACGFEKGNC
jgi:V8-like Glu-specific endopeptidase